MDPEPRTRLLREYLWFALILTAVLVGSAIQQHGKQALDSHSMGTLTVNGALH
jgi:hypothetical protein